MDKPKIILIGQDGNSFMILARAWEAARKAKWSDFEIKRFLDEAVSGDYNHLLATVMDRFDVS